MIAVMGLIYASFYFLFFKKLKLFAASTKNIAIFVGVGILMLGSIVFTWWAVSPTTGDGRVFQYVIPIVPNVKGVVVDVPIQGNTEINKGDVLFKIDPTPYQFVVDQLSAAIEQAKAQQRLAQIEVKRTAGLVKASAGSRSQLDQWNAKLASAEASVAGLTAQLDKAQWQLDETVVRAPSKGSVFNLQLRPGNYVTTVPLASNMSFVSSEVHTVLASFSQSAIRYIHVGDPVEMVFTTKPGKVFNGKVARVVKGSGTSQMAASGQMMVMTGQPENSRWAVVVDFDNPAEAAELPQSAGTKIMAVYTQKGKPLHVISKVTMRISALSAYLTSP